MIINVCFSIHLDVPIWHSLFFKSFVQNLLSTWHLHPSVSHPLYLLSTMGSTVWAFVQGSWRTHESKCPWNIVKANCHLDDYFHQNILKFDLAKQHSPNNSINKLTWSVVVHNHVHSQQLMCLYGLWSTVILFSSLFSVTWLGTIFVFQTEDGVEFPKGSKAFVQGAECLAWCWVEISSPSIAL